MELLISWSSVKTQKDSQELRENLVIHEKTPSRERGIDGYGVCYDIEDTNLSN
jgi:hypothetical protein